MAKKLKYFKIKFQEAEIKKFKMIKLSYIYLTIINLELLDFFDYLYLFIFFKINLGHIYSSINYLNLWII